MRRHRIVCGSSCITAQAIRPCIQLGGSTKVDLSLLSLKITAFEQDVSSCQNAEGGRPCSAQLNSEDLSVWCAQIQNSRKGVKGSSNLRLTSHTHLCCAIDKKLKNVQAVNCAPTVHPQSWPCLSWQQEDLKQVKCLLNLRQLWK